MADYDVTLNDVRGDPLRGEGTDSLEHEDILELCRSFYRDVMGGQRVDVENRLTLDQDLCIKLIDRVGFEKALGLADYRFFLGKGNPPPDDMWSLTEEFLEGLGKSIWDKIVMS